MEQHPSSSQHCRLGRMPTLLILHQNRVCDILSFLSSPQTDQDISSFLSPRDVVAWSSCLTALPHGDIHSFRHLEANTIGFEVRLDSAEVEDEDDIPVDRVSLSNPYRHNEADDLLDPIRGLSLSKVRNQVVIQTNYHPGAKQNQYKFRGMSNDEIYRVTLEERMKAQAAIIPTTLQAFEEMVGLTVIVVYVKLTNCNRS